MDTGKKRRRVGIGKPSSDGFFRMMADTLPCLIRVSDATGNCTWLNRSWLDFTGRAPEQEMDAGWTESVHADDRASYLDALASAIGSRQSVRIEYRLRRHDGTYRRIADETIPMIEGGAFLGLISTCTDVSHDSVESAPPGSYRFVQAVAEASPHTMYVFDRFERRAIWANRHVTAELGYTPDHVKTMGSSVVENLLHPDDLARLPELFARWETASDGQVFETEYRLKHADGSWRWFLGRDTIFSRSADGRVRQFMGTAQDITERKRAEEALLAAREEWEQTFNALTDYVCVLDRSGRIVHANRAMRERFEPTFGDLSGLDVRTVYYGEKASEPEPVDAAAQVEGLPVEVETTLPNLQGRFAVSCYPLTNAEGERSGAVSVVRDVTAHHKLEEQLRQSQKMQAIGQLAGGVAHDFNNLLTVINGYSDLLLLNLPDPTHPLRRQAMAIRNAGERAVLLTRQLLAFSRNQVLEPTIVDINEVIEQTGEMLQRLIGEDIVLNTVRSPGLYRVKVDPGQIGQLIVNLALNARDAMPNGGHLTIETRNAEFDEEYCRTHTDRRPGRFVQLAVSDTGCGMTPEVRARLFEPFFTTKPPGKGTGLGLSTVYGIVEQSEGFVSVYSEVDFGSTFHVFLPAVDAAEGATQRPAVDPGALNGDETILVVEDESGVRHIACVSLEVQGYKVIEASSGAESLRLAESHDGPIHLLLTDIVLTDMSGRQVADAVRVRYPDVEVLYMSGYTNDAIVRRGVLDESDAFLQKPFTPLALARRVRQVLDQR